MSDLIAITHADQATVERARDNLANRGNELRDKLTPGSGAMILLVRDVDVEQVLAGIEEHGHVIQTSLSDDVEAQLEAAVTAAAGRTQK